MPEHPAHGDSGVDEPIAAVVAAICLPFAIYIAFWRIDWTGDSSDSLLQYVLPVAFCVIVPSLIGSLVGVVMRSARR